MRKVVWFLLLWTVAGLLTACAISDQPLAVGDAAPDFSLEDTAGITVSLDEFSNGRPVLLYLHMAVGWPSCLTQIVDLQNSQEFQSLDVPILSIAFDSAAEMAPEGQALGITIPLLSDSDHSVSRACNVLQWSVGTGEPGHTFILVGADGKIAWIQYYGAPENRGVMYVDPLEIAANVKAELSND